MADPARLKEGTMMYRYLTLSDDTEVVHSDMMPDGRVKVLFERSDERDGYHDATCYLPDYSWEDDSGFWMRI